MRYIIRMSPLPHADVELYDTALNMVRAQFTDRDFADKVKQILNQRWSKTNETQY